MRLAYVDCFSGISGDMFLAALVDAGVSSRLLEETTAALDIGARLEIKRVMRSGISATKVDVYVGQPSSAGHQPPSSDHPHDHVGQPSPAGHRTLSDIKRILARASISAGAKQKATAIFEALGAAEAKIHNVDIEKVHFHEVGAVDAIVDIVCAAVGSEALHVDQWVFSPLNVGGGTVRCAHGTFPVPAPATVELLKDAPVYSTGLEAELVTPTGAAIARVLAARFAAFPRMTVSAAGYGAGARDFPAHANVLRITVGEALPEEAVAGADTVAVLEANLDDLNPQLFGYLMDRALAEGALEVFGTPVQMKKNRPGLLLTVLCRRPDAERMAKLIFAETTTIGVRMREEQRRVLPRRMVEVETRWGKVRLKVANMNGTVANYAPEYEDCRRLAAEHHVPLKQVMEEAVQAYLRGQNR